MDVSQQDLPPAGSLILGYPIHEAEKAEFFMQFTIFPVKRTEALISKVKRRLPRPLRKENRLSALCRRTSTLCWPLFRNGGRA